MGMFLRHKHLFSDRARARALRQGCLVLFLGACDSAGDQAGRIDSGTESPDRGHMLSATGMDASAMEQSDAQASPELDASTLPDGSSDADTGDGATDMDASDGAPEADAGTDASEEDGGAAADASVEAGADAAVVCDDGNPNTIDFYDTHLGCGVKTGATYGQFSNGLEFDFVTSLIWSPVYKKDNNLNVSYADLVAHCAALDLGGVSNFRLPTIDEVRALAAGCANTASGGKCPLSATEPVCTDQDCGLGTDCSSCVWGQGPSPAKYYCRPEIPDCLTIWTTTECTDCTGQHWSYGPGNGNFFLVAQNTLAGRCVASLPASADK